MITKTYFTFLKSEISALGGYPRAQYDLRKVNPQKSPRTLRFFCASITGNSDGILSKFTGLGRRKTAIE